MDGGAVFGVVPKVLWEKVKTPDARNRVTLATNCLLVRTPEANILIEAGVGPKLSDKARDIYGYEPNPGPLAALAEGGIRSEDMHLVIMSHLHFAHCVRLAAPGPDVGLT